MKYRLAFVLVAGIAAWAVAKENTAKEDVLARTTKLVERWVSGDKAARAGVVAETHALGEPAIAELYRRLGANRLDFPGIDPGVVMSKAEETPDWSHVVNIEVAFVTPPKDAQLPEKPTVLDAEQRKLWLERGERVSAPRLTAYNGQRCNVTVLRENGYVRTVDKGEPVAGAVRTGLMVEMRPRYDVAARAVELELRYIE